MLTALLNQQVERFGQEGHDPWELAASDPENPPELPDGVTPGPGRGLDGGVPRAA